MRNEDISSSPRLWAGDNSPVSDTTTNGIRVQVTTRYLKDRSVPQNRDYWFAYFIRISNVGDETAQLVSRHWVITNADGEEEEVRTPSGPS